MGHPTSVLVSDAASTSNFQRSPRTLDSKRCSINFDYRNEVLVESIAPLKADSSENARFEEMLDKLRLQKRGAGGVDCAAEGGLFDISNADRLGFSEVELVNMLIAGVNYLVSMEKMMEAGDSIDGEVDKLQQK